MISLFKFIEVEEEEGPETPVPSYVDISSKSLITFGP
jgi:hypothetical protein